MEMTEKRVGECNNIWIEIVQFEQQSGGKKIRKNESVSNFRYLWDNTKRSNIHVIRVLEGEGKGRGVKKKWLGREKIIGRNNDWELPEWGEIHKPTASSCSTNSAR